MRYVVRFWSCRGCGRSNQTMVEPDGSVTCEHCKSVSRIPPGKTWGGEDATRSRIAPLTA